MEVLAHDSKRPGRRLVLPCRNGQHHRLIPGMFRDDDQGGGPLALDVELDPAKIFECHIKLEPVGPDCDGDTPVGDEESSTVLSLSLSVDPLTRLEQSMWDGGCPDVFSLSHARYLLVIQRRSGCMVGSV